MRSELGIRYRLLKKVITKKISRQIIMNNEVEICGGDFEVAYHYDCRVCAKECQFRKGPTSTSERIAVACCMLFCAIITVVGIIQGINYLMENVL